MRILDRRLIGLLVGPMLFAPQLLLVSGRVFAQESRDCSPNEFLSFCGTQACTGVFSNCDSENNCDQRCTQTCTVTEEAGQIVSHECSVETTCRVARPDVCPVAPCTDICTDTSACGQACKDSGGNESHCPACEPPPPPPPPPPSERLREFQPDIPFGGRAVAVDVHPSFPNVAIVASESGGLFQTGDTGTLWSHVDSLPAFRMSDVAYSPNGQTLIATALRDITSANGSGIWRSPDGGLTWTQPPGTAPTCMTVANAWSIAFAPDSSNVYVGTDCGLQVSSDDGASWEEIAINTTTVAVVSVFASPGGIVDVLGSDGHYRSTDNAKPGTFTKSSFPGTVGPTSRQISQQMIAVDRSAPQSIFVAANSAPPSFYTLFRSTDGGKTWVDLKPPPEPVVGRGPVVAVREVRIFPFFSPFQIVYFGSGLNLYRTLCIGPCLPSWIKLSTDHTDINGIVLQNRFTAEPRCPAYVVDDGGIERTSDCGASFHLVGGGRGGYNALQIYDLAGEVHPDHTDLYFGTQDNHFFASADSGSTWTPPHGTGTEGGLIQARHFALDHTDDVITGRDFPGGAPSDFASDSHLENKRSWKAPPTDAFSTPYLLFGKTFAQWSGKNGDLTLNLTSRGGSDHPEWKPLITGVPLTIDGEAHIALPRRRTEQANLYQGYDCDPASGCKIRPTGTPAGTGIFALPLRAGGKFRRADIGLGSLGAYCPTFATLICPIVFGAHPYGRDDAELLIAPDVPANDIKISRDGGRKWATQTQLTDLVKQNGTVDIASFTGRTGFPESQVHFVEFDPSNGNRIIVGTDALGLFGSVDGGRGWFPIQGSKAIHNATDAFFDEVQNTVLVSSYGRGLWRFDLPRVDLRISASAIDASSGITVNPVGIDDIDNGDWAEYKAVDFGPVNGGARALTLGIRTKIGGNHIEFHLNAPDGRQIADFETIAAGGEDRLFEIPIPPDVRGVHHLFLKFVGGMSFGSIREVGVEFRSPGDPTSQGALEPPF